ncbi:MAG: hypothetical protein ACYTHM_02385 [Planctomycetota bacterium]|jgi:hypothetical protein
MPDLVLDDSLLEDMERSPKGFMSPDAFDRILRVLEEERWYFLTVHLRGDAPPPGFEEILERLDRSATYAVVHVHGASRPPEWLPTVPARCPIRLDLPVASTAAVTPPDPLPGRDESTGFFLPLETPAFPLEPVWASLEGNRLFKKALIGVGWEGWAGGPVAPPSRRDPPWASLLIELVSGLTDRGIETAFACGMPLCLFTTEELGRLATLKVRLPVAQCTFPWLVGCDGEIRVCQRFRRPGQGNVLKEGTLKAFRERLNEKAQPFKNLCALSPRSSCRSLGTGACGGGCFAETLSAWHVPDPTQSP